MGTFDYQFWLFKNRLVKYKYIIVVTIIIILLLMYFIFLREIRNINFYGTNLKINDKNIQTDIEYEYYIRSKKNIININFSYWYDFEIDGIIKNKQKYENFIKDFKTNKFFSCNSKKNCNFKSNEKKWFLDIVDSLYSFSKIDPIIYNQNTELNQQWTSLIQWKDPTNDTTWNTNNGQLNENDLNLSFSWVNQNIPNLQPNDWWNLNNINNNISNFGINNNLVQNNSNTEKNLSSNIPSTNPLTDIPLDDSISSKWSILPWDNIEKKIDCKEIENKNHSDCYKTPKINIKLKWIFIDYNIVFTSWKEESWKIYKKLTDSYINITWNK